MQTLLVTFDELLHIHRNAATRSSPKHTVFSFMSNFQYTPYVTVPGLPRLAPGMQVAAMLREENNWKTLIGWRDMATGLLAAPDPRWHMWRLVFLSGWLLFALIALGRNVTTEMTPQSLLLLLFAGFWAVFSVTEFRAWKQAQSDVENLKTLPSPDEA